MQFECTTTTAINLHIVMCARVFCGILFFLSMFSPLFYLAKCRLAVRFSNKFCQRAGEIFASTSVSISEFRTLGVREKTICDMAQMPASLDVWIVGGYVTWSPGLLLLTCCTCNWAHATLAGFANRPSAFGNYADLSHLSDAILATDKVNCRHIKSEAAAPAWFLCALQININRRVIKS